MSVTVYDHHKHLENVSFASGDNIIFS